MSQPKVSIVIPVYNVEKYIHQCIQSALNQTLEDIEIICVDDGSTDNCPAILDQYAKEDSRVVVIHKPNSGYGHSMNVGMDAATGEYFAILESDDIVHREMYERLYGLAKEHNADVIKSDFSRFVIKDGVFVPTKAKIANNDSMYGHVIEDDPVLVLHEAALYTWSGIYKRSFLYENGIRHNETPGASYQDNGFWFLTMSCAKRVYFHNEPFYMLRRDNPNSSTMSKAKVYCIRDEYDYILDFLKSKPELYNRVIGIYWWARFGSYRFSYRRIANEYKEEFIMHFHDVMKIAVDRGEMDAKLFSPTSTNDLKRVLADPLEYHRQNMKKVNREQMRRNPINRLLWCYEDNGMVYTIKHIAERVRQKIIGYMSNRKNTAKQIEDLNKEIKKMKKKIREMDELIKKISN